MRVCAFAVSALSCVGSHDGHVTRHAWHTRLGESFWDVSSVRREGSSIVGAPSSAVPEIGAFVRFEESAPKKCSTRLTDDVFAFDLRVATGSLDCLLTGRLGFASGELAQGVGSGAAAHALASTA